MKTEGAATAVESREAAIARGAQAERDRAWLLRCPPDCDDCREQAERGRHVYGEDVALGFRLCPAHKTEYDAIWGRDRPIVAPAPAEAAEAASKVDVERVVRAAENLRGFAGGEFPFTFRGGKSVWCGDHRVYHPGSVCTLLKDFDAALAALRVAPAASGPLPLVMWCPQCGLQHIDRGEWETRLHRTHRCDGCGTEWRPAKIYTVGVVQLAPVPEAPATPPAAPGPGR